MKTNNFKAFCDKAKKIMGKNSLPILDYVLIKDGTITATNLEVTVIQKIEGLSEIGEGLILFDNLVKIVDKLSNVDISISFYSEGEEKKKQFFVKIDSQKGTFKFSSYNPEDYVNSIECKDEFDTLSIEDANLIKTLNKYTDIKADDIKYHSVWVNGSHIVGSNGRILKFEKRESEHTDKYMIHASVINIMDSVEYSVFCANSDGGVIKNLKLVDRKNGFEIIFRMSEVRIPNWESIIPQKEKCTSGLTLTNKEVKELLDLSSLALNSANLLIFENNPAEMELTISSEDIDYGRSFSKTLCFVENEGSAIRIGMNHKLLSQIVKIEASEKYAFNFSSPNRGMLLNKNILLMPLMLG